MFHLLRLAGLWLVSLGACTAMAQPVPQPVELRGTSTISLSGEQQALVPRGIVTARDVASGQLAQKLSVRNDRLAMLGSDNELWVPLRLHNPSQRPVVWQLQFEMPTIDQVSLFQQRGGEWVEEAAGNRVAQSLWPIAGRYPRFSLEFEAGEVRSVFVRVQNAGPAPLALQLRSDAAAGTAEQTSSLGYGIAIGGLVVVLTACLVQAGVYRNAVYAWYGAYVVLLVLALTAFSGLGSQYLWGEHPHWDDVSKTVLTLAAAGASVLFVRAVCSLKTRSPALATACTIAAALVLALGVSLAILGETMPWLYGLGMVLAAAMVMLAGFFTWRRNDPVGAWVLAAFSPRIAVSALAVLRTFGIAPFDFDVTRLATGAVALILPMLLVALFIRTREDLSVELRLRGLASTDPLTGLLSPYLFRDRVQAAVERYRKRRYNAVVLYVRLANYESIRSLHGAAVTEQSMIRAAMRLRRVAPDADCLGRVGDTTIGVIIESATSRQAIMETATRFVAHGLMPLEGLRPQVTLNFHVAANSLAENTMDAGELETTLNQVLASMSPRTRRPIRFLDPGARDTLPVAIEVDDDEADAGTVAA